jgi:Domain of unknown function (DUF929)
VAKRSNPSTPSAGPSSSKSTRRDLARAELQREQQRQRRNRVLGVSAVVGVLLVVIAVLVVAGLKWQNGSGAKATGADAALVQALTTIPAATYDAVGKGEVSGAPKQIANATPLTADGKPRVLYVGAEYCPFCAAERWAAVTALARFGTFSNLGETTSSHADIYPDTPTLTFHGATYSSQYLSFTGYETESNQVQGTTYAPLDQLSTADQAVFAKYDFPPYSASSSGGSIPFIDFGGQYLSQGASYSPQLLHGLTHAKVASEIGDPSTTLSKSVLGTANTFTAALCTLTHDQPQDVCSSPGVTAAAANLG